ncbi:type 4 pilus major pilin [Pseudomonas aeruginosa]
MKLQFSRQAGATLIEIIMVVALIALITIGALTYYNSANQSNKIQQTISNITSLSSAIRNQFATQGDYNGITEAVVYSFANVPVMMKGATAGQLVHPWDQSNAAITIATASPYDTFSIGLAQIDSQTCTDIASKIYRHYDKVAVGATTISNVATAQSACSVATPTLTVTVR